MLHPFIRHTFLQWVARLGCVWMAAASVARRFAVAAGNPQPAAPQSVPSLSGTALALLGLLMGALALRRRV